MSGDTPTCRRCGRDLPISPSARPPAEASGLCQGCRAALTLARRPWLFADFVATWSQIGFPASLSWLGDVACPREALPAAGLPCRDSTSTNRSID